MGRVSRLSSDPRAIPTPTSPPPPYQNCESKVSSASQAPTEPKPEILDPEPARSMLD